MRKLAHRRNKNISKHIKTGRKKKLQKEYHVKHIENWDKNLTLNQNLDKLGQWKNVNKKITNITNKIGKEELKIRGQKGSNNIESKNNHIEVDEMNLEDLLKLNNGQPFQMESVVKKQKQLNIDQKWALEEIVKKYGTDFKKGYKDHKVNKFVWNKNQIEKFYNTYIKQYGEFKF